MISFILGVSFGVLLGHYAAQDIKKVLKYVAQRRSEKPLTEKPKLVAFDERTGQRIEL